MKSAAQQMQQVRDNSGDMGLTMEQRGEYRTRGEYGEPVTRIHRVIWDAEIGGWRPATDADPDEFCSWGAWDCTYGWMAPWEPEA